MVASPAVRDLKMVSEADGFEVDLLPLQGLWTEDLYLKLTEHTNRLIEFSEGTIEVLSIPTENHQAMLEWLFDALRAFVGPLGGKVRFAPLRVQIRSRMFREPDIVLLCRADDPRRQNRYWLGADLVVEIVSPDDPERDTKAKRADYAEAGIPEYWIVHPDEATITVLNLDGGAYREHGVFHRGDVATSVLLAGFAVAVDLVLDAS
jgi:Uma2 family endonuclease